MGIDITAYDCGRPCEIWPGLKGEGVTLFQDLNNFRTGTQIQPSLPKVLKSAPAGRFGTAFVTFVTGFTQDN